ncbi:MAG: hypothetical protein HY903_18565 [Deltaproteobacteria bacterium]|nr:hypothetical protein [Deltaproteobacteria bacterium]
MRNILCLWIVTAAACAVGDGNVSVDLEGGAPDDLEIRMVLDTGGLRLSNVGRAAGVTLPRNTDASLLRFEVVDQHGVTRRSGSLFDPRQARSETVEDGRLTARRVATDKGLLTLRVPPIWSEVIVFEADERGWHELGRAQVDPALATASSAALLNRSADVLGGAVKIVDHGAPTAKLDLLFLPEGYTAAEMEKFHADVQTSIDSMAALPDFQPYWGFFNVWRQDVRSRQSGVDDPTQGMIRDTAFDVSFNQSGVYRCVYPQSTDAYEAVVDLGKQVGADFVVILVNSDVYGGCAAGPFVLQTRSSYGGAILGHELAHSVFHLADEYSAGTCESGNGGLNVALGSSRDLIPWADMLTTDRLPTPATDAYQTTVGAFEGAGYCEHGKYRPQLTCMMRDLAAPMCAVCKREIQRYFGNLAAHGGTACTGTSCSNPNCPATWRGDGLCDPCLQDDPDCSSTCPASWAGDGWCDACVRNDPDCQP